ncbi:MAG TPA: hypothetical protein VEK34_13610 [Methylocella sp.]|nr:hypothetical protein [Methylocella sp.]
MNNLQDFRSFEPRLQNHTKAHDGPSSRAAWIIFAAGPTGEDALFARAQKVHRAEKDFHSALAYHNQAEIAYLREPSHITRKAREAAKKSVAIAREARNAEVRSLAGTRARSIAGLKLKAAYAVTERELASSILEDILEL